MPIMLRASCRWTEPAWGLSYQRTRVSLVWHWLQIATDASMPASACRLVDNFSLIALWSRRRRAGHWYIQISKIRLNTIGHDHETTISHRNTYSDILSSKTSPKILTNKCSPRLSLRKSIPLSIFTIEQIRTVLLIFSKIDPPRPTHGFMSMSMTSSS